MARRKKLPNIDPLSLVAEAMKIFFFVFPKSYIRASYIPKTKRRKKKGS